MAQQKEGGHNVHVKCPFKAQKRAVRDGDRLLHDGNKCAVTLALHGGRADQNHPLVGDKKKF